MSRRQPRPPDTGLSPSPNPPGVGLEAAQPRISDPRQLGHRSDPGRRVRSAASRRARTSWSRVSRAAARRRRLRAARHLSEHASRFRGSRGPPQTTQTGWGEPTGNVRGQNVFPLVGVRPLGCGVASPAKGEGEQTARLPKQVVVDFGPLSRPERASHSRLNSLILRRAGGISCKRCAHRSSQGSGVW